MCRLLVVARTTVSQRQRGQTLNRALTVELEWLTVLAVLDALAPLDREAIDRADGEPWLVESRRHRSHG